MGADMTNEENEIYLSLIIPAFNEEKRIGDSLERIINFLKSQSYSWEVIVVDDGSQDRTEEVVRHRFENHCSGWIHKQPANLGKGEAVKQGMLLGQGKYLFFSDSDLSVPIETLSTFLCQLENQFDVAIGTRQRAGANIEVRQTRLRECLGKGYRKLTNWILGLQISDFTCGFKGFRREAARDLFSRQRLKKWSFDSEILFLANARNYRLAEIPVRWKNDYASKVRLWKDAMGSFVELLMIRFHHFWGAYK